MGWTDERVELLKKLWADGLSENDCQKSGFVTASFVALKRESRIEAPKGISFP